MDEKTWGILGAGLLILSGIASSILALRAANQSQQTNAAVDTLRRVAVGLSNSCVVTDHASGRRALVITTPSIARHYDGHNN